MKQEEEKEDEENMEEKDEEKEEEDEQIIQIGHKYRGRGTNRTARWRSN